MLMSSGVELRQHPLKQEPIKSSASAKLSQSLLKLTFELLFDIEGVKISVRRALMLVDS